MALAHWFGLGLLSVPNFLATQVLEQGLSRRPRIHWSQVLLFGILGPLALGTSVARLWMAMSPDQEGTQ